MKTFLFVACVFLSNLVFAQNSEIKREYNCYPKEGGANLILNKPDLKSIHPEYLSTYKAGGYLGESWTIIATKLITNSQGKFLYGDLYSPRGGKLNIKINGYDGPVYVPLSQWNCN